jgi:hypothetical protein
MYKELHHYLVERKARIGDPVPPTCISACSPPLLFGWPMINQSHRAVKHPSPSKRGLHVSFHPATMFIQATRAVHARQSRGSFVSFLFPLFLLSLLPAQSQVSTLCISCQSHHWITCHCLATSTHTHTLSLSLSLSSPLSFLPAYWCSFRNAGIANQPQCNELVAAPNPESQKGSSTTTLAHLPQGSQGDGKGEQNEPGLLIGQLMSSILTSLYATIFWLRILGQ